MLAQIKAAQKERDEKETLRAMEEVKKELGLKLKKNRSPKARTPQPQKSGLNIN